MNINTVGIHELLAYGSLRYGVGRDGLSCITGDDALSNLMWHVATK